MEWGGQPETPTGRKTLPPVDGRVRYPLPLPPLRQPPPAAAVAPRPRSSAVPAAAGPPGRG